MNGLSWVLILYVGTWIVVRIVIWQIFWKILAKVKMFLRLSHSWEYIWYFDKLRHMFRTDSLYHVAFWEMLPNFLLHCSTVNMNLVFWLKVNFLGRHLTNSCWLCSMELVKCENTTTFTMLHWDFHYFHWNGEGCTGNCGWPSLQPPTRIAQWYQTGLFCSQISLSDITMQFFLVVARQIIHNFPYILHHFSGSNESLNVA